MRMKVGSFTKCVLVAVGFLILAGFATMQSRSEDAMGYFVRGNIYMNKGQYDQAISDFNKVLEINPRLPEVYLKRGVAYHRKGQHDQAIEDYSNTIRLKPDYALAYNNRCAAYNSKGLFDRAIDDCTKAIELKLSPNLQWAYNNRGNAYRNRGQYDRAIGDYNTAIRLKPDYASALHQLAHVYDAQGKHAKAEPLFRRALAIQEKALGPEHPKVAQHLEDYAALLRKMEREAEASKMEARAKAIRAKHAEQNPVK